MKRKLVFGLACAASIVTFAPPPAATADVSPLAVQYRTIEKAYHANRWALLSGVAAPGFRFVGVDGAQKTIAGLQSDAGGFAKQGGKILGATLQVGRIGGHGDTRTVTSSVTLNVVTSRVGVASRIVQVDHNTDSWQFAAGRWLLLKTVVASESVTTFGNPSEAPVHVHLRTARPPDLRAQYATIDRAFRESRWDLVRTFAMSDARFIEVDGSAKTLDELTAAGKAFTSAGGRAVSAHMLPAHVVRTKDGATVAVLTTAAGTYPAGARRLRFAQQVAQQDTWKRVDDRWLYAGGRVLRQTITTFAPDNP